MFGNNASNVLSIGTFVGQGLLLIVLAAPAIMGQGCLAGGASGGLSTLSATTCVQVTVPKGRQFVIISSFEELSYWETGSGCNVNNCDGFNLSMTLSGAGVSETISFGGSAASRPGGSGWVAGAQPTPGCGNKACQDCGQISYDQSRACTQNYLPGPAQQECYAQVHVDLKACYIKLNAVLDNLLFASRTFAAVVPLPPQATANGDVTLDVDIHGPQLQRGARDERFRRHALRHEPDARRDAASRRTGSRVALYRAGFPPTDSR